MHVQIINYRLNGVGEEEYGRLCEQLAPGFASVPGLVQKVWLADYEAGIFGGVYLWRDRQAMERFGDSELFKLVMAHPNLADITSRDFEVLDAPTRLTRGFAELAA